MYRARSYSLKIVLPRQSWYCLDSQLRWRRLQPKLQEIIAGTIPYAEVSDRAIHYAIVVKKKIPKRPEDHIPPDSICGDILWTLLRSCWSNNPQRRPSAADVRDFVSAMITPTPVVHSIPIDGR
jgi:hypothetical protein